jgi:hypothetical protein
MTNIFNLENIEEFSEKLNIDELYEKKRQYDLGKLALFNKILNRIHVRIKNTSRQKIDEQFCWFVVPEIIIGVPKYDQAACIAYLIDKLKNNGFNVRYIHPNTLFISWENWVPTYVRNEIKKKRGIIINEKGEIVGEVENNEKKGNTIDEINENSLNINSISKNNDPILENKKYNPISNYKPVGNLVYKQELFNKLERKIV